MLKSDFKLEYSSSTSRVTFPIVVVAAGSSRRMNGLDKMFLEINGIPVIARTLLAFEDSPLISNIILVTRNESIVDMQKIVQKYNISKVKDIVEGGTDRFSSVLNGMAQLENSDDFVLIHDGARPLVDGKTIGNVCAALQNYPAAVCAVPIKDTVKFADAMGNVDYTPDRSKLYSAQTPQGVSVKLYKQAVNSIKDFSLVTDDAYVMEAAGYEVKIVMGDYRNIKITTVEDIALAEILSKGE